MDNKNNTVITTRKAGNNIPPQTTIQTKQPEKEMSLADKVFSILVPAAEAGELPVLETSSEGSTQTPQAPMPELRPATLDINIPVTPDNISNINTQQTPSTIPSSGLQGNVNVNMNTMTPSITLPEQMVEIPVLDNEVPVKQTIEKFEPVQNVAVQEGYKYFKDTLAPNYLEIGDPAIRKANPVTLLKSLVPEDIKQATEVKRMAEGLLWADTLPKQGIISPELGAFIGGATQTVKPIDFSENLLNIPAEVATGAISFAANDQVRKNVLDNAYKNYVNSYNNMKENLPASIPSSLRETLAVTGAGLGDTTKFAWNSLTEGVGADTGSLDYYKSILKDGNITPEEAGNLGMYLGNVYTEKTPQTAVDVASILLAGGTGTAARAAIAKTPKGIVRNTNLIGTAKRAYDVNVMNKEMENIIKKNLPVANAATGTEISFADLLKAMEEGLDTIPKQHQIIANKLADNWQKYYDKFPVWAKVSEADMAIPQYVVRKTGITFEQARDAYLKVKQIKDGLQNELNNVTTLLNYTLGTDIKTPTIKFNRGRIDNISELGISNPSLDNTIYNIKISQQSNVANKIPEEYHNLTGKEYYYKLIDKYNDESKAASELIKNGIHYVDEGGVSPTSLSNIANNLYNPKTNTIELRSGIYGRDELTLVHEYLHAIQNELAKKTDYSKIWKSEKLTDFEEFVDDYLRYARNGGMSTPNKKDFLDMINDAVKNIDDTMLKLENTATNDYNLKTILEGINKFDSDNIRATMHIMSEADKEAIGKLSAGRKYYGKFTPRAWGKTSYETLAKELSNPNSVLYNSIQNSGEMNLINELITKKRLSKDNFVKNNANDEVIVLDEKTLTTDGVEKAIDKGRLVPASMASPEDIKISVPMANAIKEEFKPNNFMSGVFGDAYKVNKAVMLSGGTYIMGNLITGLSNLLLDSGFDIAKDIRSALKTGGQLSKNLGLYRYDKKQKLDTKVGKALTDVNYYTGGNLLRNLDRTVQNTVTEIASNAALRRAGVPESRRLENILDVLPAEKAANAIDEARLTSLLASEAVLPKELNKALSLAMPFIGYQNAAIRSTFDMMLRHPIRTNIALNHILGRVGYDAEMQNRQNLGVKSDKPFVTYRFDDRTGSIKEGTIEFMPMITSIKTTYNAMDIANRLIQKGEVGDELGTLLDPILLTELSNAARGKTRYGTPSRTRDTVNVGGKKYNVKTGKFIEGGTAKELAATTIKNLFGLPNTLNKTVLPAGAALYNMFSNEPIKYYQPYADEIFGSYQKVGDVLNGTAPSSSGDYTKPRAGRELLNSLGGYYETDYYQPTRDYSTPTLKELRNIMWSQQREQNKIRNRNLR